MSRYVQFDKRGPYCNFEYPCAFFTRTGRRDLESHCVAMDRYGSICAAVIADAWVNFCFEI